MTTRASNISRVLAGLWSVAVGFGEERLADAAAAQMRKLPYYHSFSHKSHPAAIALAERLVRMAPGAMSKAHFTSSGSEANDFAIKMIWYYNNALGRPGKKKIISRQRAYHGVTIASGSLTGLPAFHRDFDLPLPMMRHVSCPHFWRFGAPGESEEDFATRLAVELEDRDRRGRAGDGGRVFWRAGDGRRRRHSPASNLLGEDPGGVPAPRRAHRRRRSHHRIWPHRANVRV